MGTLSVIIVVHRAKLHWNGVLEGINSLIQAAKARGYLSDRNLIAMVYLKVGRLNPQLPI